MRRIVRAAGAGIVALGLPGCGGSGCDLYPDTAVLSGEEMAREFFLRFGGAEGSLSLTDLPDLSQAGRLCQVGGDLRIETAGAVDLSALDRLELVGGRISLLDMPALQSLEGLDRLFAARSLLVATTGVRELIWDNTVLAMESVDVQENRDLTSAELRLSDAGAVSFWKNPALTRVSLPDLRRASRLAVGYSGTPVIEAPALQQIDELSITDGADLDLPGLLEIGVLGICGPVSGSVGATSLVWLNACIYVDVLRTMEMADLEFPALSSIAGIGLHSIHVGSWPAWPALRAVGNLSLLDVTGVPDLRWLSGVAVGGVFISRTDTASLAGLEGTTALQGLDLDSVNSLSDASALADLAEVGVAGMVLADLPALRTLDLPALTRVEGSLYLNRLALDDLSGLSALGYVGGDLTITHNVRLSAWEIREFLAHVEVRGAINASIIP